MQESSVRRSVVCAVAMNLFWSLGFVGVSHAQTESQVLEVVRAWVEARTRATAFEIVWEQRISRADPSNAPGANAAGEVIEKMVFRYRCRWPDVLYTEEELRTRETGKRTIVFRTEEDASLRAQAARRHSQLFVTPGGDLIERRPGLKRFDVKATGVSLQHMLDSQIANIPMLVAHRIADNGLGDYQIRMNPVGEIEIRRPGGVFTYVLAPVAPGGEMVMARIERLNKAGELQLAFEFRDFRPVDTCSYPVAHIRALSMPSERNVIMDGDRPVRVEYSGELRETSVDRLVFFAAYETLSDSAFTPDLEGFTTFDESSGRLLDSKGNTVGQTTARRKISRPRQWSTLIGAGGVALIVLAIGAWWIRRRGA